MVYCFSNAADIVVYYNNLEYVSNNLGYLAPMITTYAKTFTLWISQDKIKRLIKKVHSPIEFLKFSSDLGVLTHVRTAIFYQNFDYVLFNGVTISVTYVTFFAIPREEDELPLRGIFPFDVSEFPLHQLAYFIQIYTIFVGCIWALVFDTTVLGLTRWIYVQLMILKYNCRHCSIETYDRANFTVSPEAYNHILNYNWFTLDKEKEYVITTFVPFSREEAYVKNDSFELRLKTCLKHYRRLILNVDELNDTFSAVLFGMIAATFCLVCLNLFLAVLGESMYKSIYDSKWENHLNNGEIKINILNALLMALKPLRLSAGTFFIFSMETWLSV
ncbi:GSCOCT00013799001.3-RA-CDS, partial [Cotesia congregata]